MNLGPKKDGSPNIDFFQSPETLQGFETVRLWLQKHHKKVSDEKSKAKMAANDTTIQKLMKIPYF